jgi:hypothetical protein
VSARTVVLELAGEHKLARDLVAGGVFVPGEALPLNEECELVLRDATQEIRVRAMVVFANDDGIGLQLHNCDAEMKQRIAGLGASTAEPVQDLPAVEAASDAEVPSDAEAAPDGEAAPDCDEEAAGDDKKQSGNLHERLRGLTLAQQIKLAHHGEVSERVVLERLYGKAVWEALLRNPRLTGPEVARIARMGSLPRPMMEIIVGNGGWLQIPEVRRALLTNPRLATDQILRILRMLPKHELKLAAMQTIYPLGVRDQAKKLIKEAGGG